MILIDRAIIVQRSAEVLFPIVSDPLRFLGLFSGSIGAEQVSEEGQGLGSRYLVLMRVGPINAGSILQITQWRSPGRLAWKSEQGVSQTGSVNLEPMPGGSTEVRIQLAYTVPGPRLPAFLVERLTRHVVDRRILATLLSIKRIAEFDLDRAEAQIPGTRVGLPKTEPVHELRH